jgi:hypothetical protein
LATTSAIGHTSDQRDTLSPAITPPLPVSKEGREGRPRRRRWPPELPRLMASAAWSKPPASASVDLLRLSPSHIHTTLASVRTCVSIDFWPSNKQCRAGVCPWEKASALTADLNDPLLVAAVGALLPLTIRVGGSLADQITYTNIPGQKPEPCEDLARNSSLALGYTGGCLSWERYTSLFRLCKPPLCGLILHINALRGRQRETCPADIVCRTGEMRASHKCCTGHSGAWDARNALSLLGESARAGLKPFGIAYGNEIGGPRGLAAKLEAKQYASEVANLSLALQSIWHDGARPLLLAPDVSSIDTEWIGTFLKEIRRRNSLLDVLTYHKYPLHQGDPHADERGAAAMAMRDKLLQSKAAKIIRGSLGNVKAWYDSRQQFAGSLKHRQVRGTDDLKSERASPQRVRKARRRLAARTQLRS